MLFILDFGAFFLSLTWCKCWLGTFKPNEFVKCVKEMLAAGLAVESIVTLTCGSFWAYVKSSGVTNAMAVLAGLVEIGVDVAVLHTFSNGGWWAYISSHTVEDGLAVLRGLVEIGIDVAVLHTFSNGGYLALVSADPSLADTILKEAKVFADDYDVFHTGISNEWREKQGFVLPSTFLVITDRPEFWYLMRDINSKAGRQAYYAYLKGRTGLGERILGSHRNRPRVRHG